MPRGGYRPGSGRKARPIPPEVAGLGRYPALVERLNGMPSSPAGRRRRVVLALAAHDASEGTIAAALAISEDELRRRYPEELATGLALKSASVAMATWELARAGKWSAISWLLRRLDAEEERQGAIDTAHPRRRRR